jgi:predicted RNA-binding Zn-ribbon protein involved in translation (DUF1610 family)
MLYTVDVLDVHYKRAAPVHDVGGWWTHVGTRDIRVDCPKCGNFESWFIDQDHVDAEGCTIGDGDHACPGCGISPRGLKLLGYSGWPFTDMKNNPRCSDGWCCKRMPLKFSAAGSCEGTVWPQPCLNCGIGLIHCSLNMETFAFAYRCDSCDRWRYKASRAPLGVDDCLCVFDPKRPWPACPHDIRGPEGTPGTVGLRMI